MNNKPTHRIRSKPLLVALAILLAAALSISAYAIVKLLSPADVARQMGHDALAEVFENSEGTLINKSVASEGYVITLHGMASGKNLLAFTSEVDIDKSFLVVSVRPEDGSPMDYFAQGSGIPAKSFSSCVLFEGHQPWILNAITLGGQGGQAFEQDGVFYVLMDCSNFEMFAERAVYLAVWDSAEIGFAPSANTFQLNGDGSIAFVDGLQIAHAMFTLPLDPAKADPARVAQILEEIENPPIIEEDPNDESFEWREVRDEMAQRG